MGQVLTRNRYFALKPQSALGTDAVPTTAANALRVEGPTVSQNPQSAQTNEATASLDASQSSPAGATGSASFTVNLKHSGTPATPPDFGAALRCCAMQERITAAAVTGTAQAGAANTITLAVGASAVDNFYQGMPITTTGGTGSGQTNYISAYNGTTKVATVVKTWSPTPDATTGYSIPACVRYEPESAGFEWASIYAWLNRSDGGLSRLLKLIDAQGTWSLNLGVRNFGKLAFTFSGAPVDPVDVSAPTAPVLQGANHLTWYGADVYLGTNKIKPTQLTIDYGANVAIADDTNGALGYAEASVTARRTTGRINPPTDLLSVIDPWSMWKNGTVLPFVTSWGASAGKRCMIMVPQLHATGRAEEDVNGFSHDGIPFEALGDNAGVFITLW